MRVAILGANGFIGGRLVEVLHKAEATEVIPIIRDPSKSERLIHLSLEVRHADAFEEEALTTSFRGCEIVVSCIAGPPEIITGTIKPMYNAAERAGIRRIIYLSSAVVHGQAPAAGTREETQLCDRQPIPYNNAKVRAEWKLRQLRERKNVEIVILRPGIVWGPRSSWVTNFANALLNGAAYLTNDGRGICNSIYVDNLAHAIRLAMQAEGIDLQAFFLGDKELIRWIDFYAFIATALGYDIADVPRIEPLHPPKSTGLPALRSLKTLLRRAVRHTIFGFEADDTASPHLSRLQATLEMSLLYACNYKLCHEKASCFLNYHPTVSFAEGCRHTISWMANVGYPVKDDVGQSSAIQQS